MFGKGHMRYNVQVLRLFSYLYCNDFNRKTQGGSYAERAMGRRNLWWRRRNSAEESEEGTITVLAGEGEAAIAARAGISIAELEQLNPSHMSTGSWYANPGDVVKIK